MLNALRFGRPLHQPYLAPFSLSSPKPTPSAIRFVQSASREMDSEKQSKPESKTVDSMSSFGEGYATRSDEEGFGGIYGGNQYFSKDDDEKDVHEDSQDQGSEVKEKEKARNQSKVA